VNNSLTIIFPFYNEENRINKSLDKISKFVKFNISLDLEIIFVNDGSNDRTDKIIHEFLEINDKKIYKYFKENKNMGKGYALKIGVKNAEKDWILTSDIDLSVPLEQIKLWKDKNKIEADSKVYFGSRNVGDSKVVKKFYRFILGTIFNNLIKFLFKININDTQCGFKLYEKEIAKDIFEKLETFGFAHDIELVIILNAQGIKIKELPVNWTHISGSKLNIFLDTFKMLIDILKIYKNFKNK
jgi:dolichyl-phosphate beta-glucosyltransferase|tara:strand:+ start:50 stop:775 length:726 start_codon:yes stop_codon:yes gene_type:complete